jgi:hypothetical protein
MGQEMAISLEAPVTSAVEADIRYQPVLSLLTEGRNDEEIAARLMVDPNLVAVFRDHAYSSGGFVTQDRMKAWQDSYLGSTEHVQQFDFGALEGRKQVESLGKILAPPGCRLWNLAEFFCTKRTYGSIFIPLLAEFQHEYFDALKNDREWKARWLRVLYCGAFFKSAGLNVAMRFLREAWDRFKKVTP